MNKTIQNVNQIRKINERFGTFMRTERERQGLSIYQIAQWLCLKPEKIHRWEVGYASPPAETFYRLVCLYGEDACFRASQLNLEIQIEWNRQHEKRRRSRSELRLC